MKLGKTFLLVLTVLLVATSSMAQSQECTNSSTQNCVSPPSIDVDRQTGLIITTGLLLFTASFYHHHLKEKEKRK